MFQIGNVQRITKYLLICALTLSSECQAAVNRVQYWGGDDEIYFFTTTRRPYIWEWFTDVPTYNPPSDFSEQEGRTIFFVILFVSVTIITFIVYLCRRQWNEQRFASRQVSGATIHPPPIMSGARTLPTTHSYQSGNSAMATTQGYYSGNSRPLLAFSNAGYQNGSSIVDVPPDYATVAIADLTTQNYNFPIVVPVPESPPPKYTEGCTFP